MVMKYYSGIENTTFYRVHVPTLNHATLFRGLVYHEEFPISNSITILHTVLFLITVAKYKHQRNYFSWVACNRHFLSMSWKAGFYAGRH